MKCAIVNPNTPNTILDGLVQHGFRHLSIPTCNSVAHPIAGHPDIQLCIVNTFIVYHPDMDISFLETLSKSTFTLIRGQSQLNRTYPYDCAYNCAFTGAVAFHNTHSTDAQLQKIFQQCSIPLVHVNQAYSKCSTCIVDTDAIITADRTIYKAALQANIDALIITPGYILLPGYNYGFIGGASGLCSDTVYFTGTLHHHPDCSAIENFVAKHHKNIVYLSKFPIIDIGSLFFIELRE